MPPELLDQAIGGDDLVGVQEEQSKERAGLGSAQRNRVASVPDLEPSQDPEFHFAAFGSDANTCDHARVKAQVPLESWQVGPWNRWAYVHVDEVIDTVPVTRGDGPIAQPESGAGDIDDLVAPLLETAYVDGLAVVHRGRLVAEHYRAEMTETSLHLSQSVGKSVLGLLWESSRAGRCSTPESWSRSASRKSPTAATRARRSSTCST